ncbi:hypothetical protein EYF80_018276 [Liparis tanakae]|uniref:Uncharacterized protein n=1 Tax=Liparis tanakae TaxID=230148 RepID=A0A4Z2I2H9_9TELE|nr:hypothetical protein EYF80_018276 [Liparis tanakae]
MTSSSPHSHAKYQQSGCGEECGGLESILHSRVLPGTTDTVSWTSGMSSASSFSPPSCSSWKQPSTSSLPFESIQLSLNALAPELEFGVDGAVEDEVPDQTLCMEGTHRGMMGHLLRYQPETLILSVEGIREEGGSSEAR